MKKRIAFGCDHGGFAYKNEIIDRLVKNGYTVIDCGTDSSASVDYPAFADKVCKEITSANADLGILVCGTGIGMSMAANKHAGIRAACCENTFSARMTRMHNDANVLCLGARVIGIELAHDMIDLFVTTEFEGGRHQNRVNMINDLD
jgi:ribose 5-phosphate isomerase B